MLDSAHRSVCDHNLNTGVQMNVKISNPDGDYETSSEGPYYQETAQDNNLKDASSAGSWKMGTRGDNEAEDLESKEEKSSGKSLTSEEVLVQSNVPTKSESMPLLKNTPSLKEEAIIVSSESSFARRRKMKMIVARIDPLLSSGSSQTLARSSGGSTTELREENYQAKKLESRTALPVLQSTDCDPSNRLKEVTFHELPEDKDFSSQQSQSSEKRRSKPSRPTTWDVGSQQQLPENSDLIDIAENPHPSMKSFYFPPNPEKGASSASLRTKIINELCPLLHQMNEIRGKLRILSLTDPSLLNQRHHSTQCASFSNASSYYLHHAETFSRGGNVHLIDRRMMTETSQEAAAKSFSPVSTQMVSLSHDLFSTRKTISQNVDTHVGPSRHSSRCVETNVSTGMSNWTIGEDDSQVTLNNFNFRFGQFVHKDPSGSLIPSVSSTCYKCHRNRAYHFDDAAGCSQIGSYVVPSSSKLTENDVDTMGYSSKSIAEKPLTKESRQSFSAETKESWTPNSQVQLISVNTEVYTAEKSFNEDVVQDSAIQLQGQSVPAPLTSKTSYLTSQTSLMISKKDQEIMTSDLEEQETRSTTRKKAVRNLDVQCSGLNLKEIVLRQSVKTLLRPSESEGGSSTKSIQVTDEKVVVVPIVFTDGVPEPPKFSMLAVSSRTQLPRMECRLLKIKKRLSSMTQGSVESRGRSPNKGYSGMSLSCVSRSSLRCRNVLDHRKPEDRHRRPGSAVSGYTESIKMHSESGKKAHKKVLYGMRSSPEDFAFDT